jgi:hypothetical protein
MSYSSCDELKKKSVEDVLCGMKNLKTSLKPRVQHYTYIYIFSSAGEER